jgi:hypothetical protein
VSFAFGVVGHRLRCSWCCRGNCYTLSSCEPFQFSDFTVEPKNTLCYCVVCRMSLEEDISPGEYAPDK